MGRSYLDETGITATDPITGEVLRKGGMGVNAKTTSQLAGLAGGLSAIFTGNAVGLDDSEVADNIFSGQRIAQNAVDNNLTLFVHGTKSSPNTFSREFRESISEDLSDPNQGDLEWSGDNTKEARTKAAYDLKSKVDSYIFEKGEHLNFVCHSHGCNVVKEYSQLADMNRSINDLGLSLNLLDITYINNPLNPKTGRVLGIAGPNRPDYVMNQNTIPNYTNYYDLNDTIQGKYGGIDFIPNFPYINKVPTSNIAIEPNAINVPINQYKTTGYIINSTKYLSPLLYPILKTGLGYKSHTNIQSNETYNNFIRQTTNNNGSKSE